MRNILLTSLALALAARAGAQTVAPEFAGSYRLADLGAAPAASLPYGALALERGDPNSLLIGNSADTIDGLVLRAGLTRSLIDGKMRVTGFDGTFSHFADAPYIDGGLAYGPDGALLYTGYPVNLLGQIDPSGAAPTWFTYLDPALASVGSIVFAPSGGLKVMSYDQNSWSDLPYTLDTDGQYLFGAPANAVQLSGGLVGAVYVPGGSPLFARPAVLVCEFDTGSVVAYDTDANGDPVPATRRPLVTDLGVAIGATLDPMTGDVLVSTYDGDRVVAIRGFAPVPEPASLLALGLGGAALLRRRGRSSRA